jgi:hypothetical protein
LIWAEHLPGKGTPDYPDGVDVQMPSILKELQAYMLQDVCTTAAVVLGRLQGSPEGTQ